MDESSKVALVLLFLCSTLTIAAINDLRFHRVPNVLSLLLGVAGLLFSAIGMGAQGGLLDALLGGSIGLVLLLPLYAKGAMGAGDVKLMAASATFLGAVGSLAAVVATVLIGAVISIALGFRQVSAEFDRSSSNDDVDLLGTLRRQRVPYAPSIMLAVSIVAFTQYFALLGE